MRKYCICPELAGSYLDKDARETWYSGIKFAAYLSDIVIVHINAHYYVIYFSDVYVLSHQIMPPIDWSEAGLGVIGLNR